MNPLDRFTVERLEQISRGDIPTSAWSDEMQALAKIALSAKQAKPVAEVYQSEKVGICAPLGPQMRMFGWHPAGTKFYLFPPAPQLPDGWIKCCELMPPENEEVLTWDGIIRKVHHTTFGQWQCWQPEKITHWMPLPAAPKPE